ncbi:MAG: YraN family protein, partial [Actinomycetota bacterium]
TVVCEVKTRTSRYFGSPSEAVGPDKRRRLRRLAAEWLSENPCRGSLRFDVAEVVMTDGGPPELDVIESAF